MSPVTPLIGPATAPDVHVMSFNIRRPMDGFLIRPADRWLTREGAVRVLLNSERPSLVGLQEALPHAVASAQTALGAHYRSIGRGRGSDGSGEGNPILYDADRLQLVEWTQLALSDTPDTPGSTGWGNLIPRIMVAAVFEDRATSVRFLVVNTHLDHLSGRSRRRSARVIRRRVAEQQLPAIVMGDLNASAGSRTLRRLLADGTLADAWVAAERRRTPGWGTNPRYRRPRIRGRRIDFVTVTSDVHVVDAAINARSFGGRWPSDHLPVQATLRLPIPTEAP